MGRVFLTSNFRSTLLAESLSQIETVLQQLEDQINDGPAIASLNAVNRKLPQGMRNGDIVFDLQNGELRVGIFNGASVQYVSFGSFTGAITDAQHGNRGGGSLHPAATTSVAGFMSAADKVALNAAFILPVLTSGSILFSNGTTIAQDNANLFFDNTNNRVGIGTATPADVLIVKGSGTGYVSVGQYPGFTNYATISLNQNNSGTAYALASDGTSLLVNSPSGSSISFRHGHTEKMTLSAAAGLNLKGTGVIDAIGNAGSTASNGYSEWRATNNGGTANDRMTFGIGGTATGDYYQNKGYLLTSFNVEALLLQAAKSNGYMVFATGGATAAQERMRLDSTGRLGIGQTAPTACIHIKAGTATANTAPLKLTSGTNLTTAETGAVEYNGTNLFFTRTGTTRENVLVGNDAAAAPGTNAVGVIVDYFGTSATRVLTTPNSWAGVNIAGTAYKIPLYT